MTDLALRAADLSKLYRIGVYDPYLTFRRSVKRSLRQAKRFALRQPPLPAASAADSNILWALKNVSFEIKQGEAVGIIGPNGAGKSTLLKILSHITKPTSGFADIYGRLGALLEVGTGFHPELTGRENIFLNATILGMKKDEILRRFDEIVDFAEIEKFIDTPVKHYSSGMFMRLAFSVAAHLEPDILVLDEVLSVGDAAFQRKSLGKMEGVTKSGRTVLFVSHSMPAVKTFCNRAILLSEGCVKLDGSVDMVINAYLKETSEIKTSVTYADEPSREIQFLQTEVVPDPVSQDYMLFKCSYRVPRPLAHLQDVLLCVDVKNALGTSVFYANDEFMVHPQKRAVGTHTVALRIPVHLLAPGEYSIAYGFWQPSYAPAHFPEERLGFVVNEKMTTQLSAHNIPWPSAIYSPTPDWEFFS